MTAWIAAMGIASFGFVVGVLLYAPAIATAIR